MATNHHDAINNAYEKFADQINKLTEASLDETPPSPAAEAELLVQSVLLGERVLLAFGSMVDSLERIADVLENSSI